MLILLLGFIKDISDQNLDNVLGSQGFLERKTIQNLAFDLATQFFRVNNICSFLFSQIQMSADIYEAGCRTKCLIFVEQVILVL